MPEYQLCAESELPAAGKSRSFLLADAPPPANASEMFRTVSRKGRRMAVFRTEAGIVYVTDDRCPHLEATLHDGRLVGNTITCKWHFWQFDLQSGACLLAANCSLPMYKTRLADGIVFVSIDEGT